MTLKSEVDLTAPARPMGVIDTLSAGISIMARHPWLLLMPILLDLFLWLGSPLSLAPDLVQALLAPLDPAQFGTADLPPDVAGELPLLREAMERQLSGVNLWSFLVSPFLFWPTVLAGQPRAVGEGGMAGLQVGSPGELLLGSVAIALLGFWLNLAWLQALVHSIRGESLLADPGRFLRKSLQHAIKLVVIGLLLMGALVGILVPTLVALAVVSYLLPAIGQLLSSAFALGASWALLWIGLHLYFLPAAVVAADLGVLRAPLTSVSFVRRFFWRAVAFIGVTILLSGGFQLIWFSMSSSAAGLATSIVANAALGTAIAIAMLIFFTQRLPLLAQGADEREREGVRRDT